MTINRGGDAWRMTSDSHKTKDTVRNWLLFGTKKRWRFRKQNHQVERRRRHLFGLRKSLWVSVRWKSSLFAQFKWNCNRAVSPLCNRKDAKYNIRGASQLLSFRLRRRLIVASVTFLQKKNWSNIWPHASQP